MLGATNQGWCGKTHIIAQIIEKLCLVEVRKNNNNKHFLAINGQTYGKVKIIPQKEGALVYLFERL